jgi:hypothetical protein
MGLMVSLWFTSGVVMLFVARPQLDEAERLAGLPVFDTSGVQISPLAAWRALGLPDEPTTIRLNASGGKLAYRILIDKKWYVVDAENGKLLPPIDREQARKLARDYGGLGQIEEVNRVDLDQWTVYRRFDPFRPFWRVEFLDGREFYISMGAGELVLDTTTDERIWNWLGSVIHWIYITPLRQHTELWRNIILWFSFAALILTLTGLWLGLQRLRLRLRYSGGRITPYRSGWKRWHHLLGLAGAIVLVSWLLSGWLSMAPFGLAEAPRKPDTSYTLFMPALASVLDPGRTAKEIEWNQVGNTVLRVEKHSEGSLISLNGMSAVATLTLNDLEGLVREMELGPIKRSAWLYESDSRYYPLRHHPRSFPVARFELDDQHRTVLYISPSDCRIKAVSNRDDFAYRWLYHGLHRLDFPFIVEYPFLRDMAVIVLSILGFSISLSGCVLGWHRIMRNSTGQSKPGRG